MQQLFLFFSGLSTVALLTTNLSSQAHQAIHRRPVAPRTNLVAQAPGIPVRGCLTRPKKAPPEPNLETKFIPGALTLDRFRQQPAPPSLSAEATRTNAPRATLDYVAQHQPVEKISLAHPTNFGERYLLDYQGQPAYREPIIVLHETVISGPATLKLFGTNHPKNSQQVSYHALIMRDGTIYYLVPPDKRAFGAGTSVFSSSRGDET
ncbi:MAG: peptidoglycan recognition family protein, partial [Cyanobacteria bacterium P01_A01_bin.17]